MKSCKSSKSGSSLCLCAPAVSGINSSISGIEERVTEGTSVEGVLLGELGVAPSYDYVWKYS